jgi:hexosaminidase
MPKNIVIQSWRGRKSLYESAREGYTGILSNGYYIDLIQPAEFHYLNDPIPPDTTLPESTVKNIWGGEATMWSELVTPDNVDSRIWPRTAAIAERLWSPQSVRDVDDMYNRMEVFSLQLEELGINHIRNQDMMLRRLVRGYDIQPLKILTEVVEPVKIYTRHRQGRSYTSYSPYTRVVDAAQPESMTGRQFRKAVDRFIASGNKADEEYIINLMHKWNQNHSAFSDLTNEAPVLKENLMLSQNLAELSRAGLESIKMIKNNSEAAEGWFESNMKLIDAAKVPYGQAELAVTGGFEALFKAAKGGKPLKSPKPSKN